jgi:hypothetical protein
MVPSLKSTSLSPAEFEDRVSASLLLRMMLDEYLHDQSHGRIVRLQWGRRDWLPFDDLVATTEDLMGEMHICGISIKSGRKDRMLLESGAVPEFVDGVWRRLRSPNFNKLTDSLMLCDSGNGQIAQASIDTLLAQCKGCDVNRIHLEARPKNLAKMYDSFASEAGSEFPAEALQLFWQRSYGFLESTGYEEAEQIVRCGWVLSDTHNSLEERTRLWERLRNIARDHRSNGWDCDLPKLAALLRHKFQLKKWPCDMSELALLRNESQGSWDQISDKLGADCHLPVAHIQQKVDAALTTSSVIVLEGPSGIGKSALAKRTCLASRTQGAFVAWLAAGRVAEYVRSYPKVIEAASRITASQALLVIDGFEDLRSEDVASVGHLISLLLAIPESPWRILITCQLGEWDRNLAIISRFISSLGEFTMRLTLDGLSDDDLNQAAAKFPEISHVLDMPHLRSMLKNAKLLELAIYASNSSSAWTSENELIDWWWRERVGGGKTSSTHQALVKKLAKMLADELKVEVPLGDVDDHSDEVHDLSKSDVLRVHRERVQFTHGLHADWSRLKLLISLGDEWITFSEPRMDKGPWLRAIRLLAQDALTAGRATNEWRGWISKLAAGWEGYRKPSLQQLQLIDLLLEAICYCPDARTVMETLSPELFSNQGRLLDRLIRRVMKVAGVEDERLAPIARELFQDHPGEAEKAVLTYRLPIRAIWQPLADFLCSHDEIVTELAPLAVAEFTNRWALCAGRLGVDWKPSARLALLNARKALRCHISGHYGRCDDKTRKEVYKSALQASVILPDEVDALIEKIVGIKGWEEGDLPKGYTIEWKGLVNTGSSHPEFASHDNIKPGESWPNGATRWIDLCFPEVWFSLLTPVEIIYRNPALAARVTLACLIEWPKKPVPDHHLRSCVREHGFRYQHLEFHPTFHNQGNFGAFLHCHFAIGLKLIIDLVNFATDRFVESCWPSHGKEPPITLDVNGQRTDWWGGARVYSWYRDCSGTERVVTCALMALEKWFYDSIDKKRDVGSAIEVIFRDVRSLAFGGLLMVIGKYHPELFFGKLLPLVCNWMIVRWDIQDSNLSHMSFGLRNGDPEINKAMDEWEGMPHRNDMFRSIGARSAGCCPDYHQQLSVIRSAWLESARTDGLDETTILMLGRWAAWLDPSCLKQTPDGRHFEVILPDHLKEIPAETHVHRRSQLLTIPFKCRELLACGDQLTSEAAGSAWASIEEISVWEPLGGRSAYEEAANDPKHSITALLSVLLCKGDAWLATFPKRKSECLAWLEEILNNPAESYAYSEKDGWADHNRDPIISHYDSEMFCAHALIHVWSQDLANPKWRRFLVKLIASWRYATVWILFNEACRLNERLGKAHLEILSVGTSFSLVREHFNFRHKFNSEHRLVKAWLAKQEQWFVLGESPSLSQVWRYILNHQKRRNAMVSRQTRDRWPRSPAQIGYHTDMTLMSAVWRSTRDCMSLHAACECDKHFSEMLIERLQPLSGYDLTKDKCEHAHVYESGHFILDRLAMRLVREDGSLEWNDRAFMILRYGIAAPPYVKQLLSSVYSHAAKSKCLDAPWFIEMWTTWQTSLEQEISWLPLTHSRRSSDAREIKMAILLFGLPFVFIGAEANSLVTRLLPAIKTYMADNGFQPRLWWSLIHFVIGDESRRAWIPDIFEWLHPELSTPSGYFAVSAGSDTTFRELLSITWHESKVFPEVWTRPSAMASFRTLAMACAVAGDAVAINIQEQMGQSS